MKQIHKRQRTNECCCSCFDSSNLLLIGCSNEHTICHPCSREYMSAKIVMHKFPYFYPTRILNRRQISCPICQEKLNGVSNMFVKLEEPEMSALVCPYKNLIIPAGEQCQHAFTTTVMLQNHILSCHNNVVKCPYCNMWLDNQNRELESLIEEHVAKNCKKIPCHGCNRKSNMINLCLHSSVKDDNSICSSSHTLPCSFGSLLSYYVDTSDTPENIEDFSFITVKWIYEYLCVRLQISVDFENTFSDFLVESFCQIHSDVNGTYSQEERRKQLITMLTGKKENEYQGFLLVNACDYAKKHDIEVSQLYKLPVVYKSLISAMTNFDRVYSFFSKRNSSTNEECVTRLAKEFVKPTNGLYNSRQLTFSFITA